MFQKSNIEVEKSWQILWQWRYQGCVLNCKRIIRGCHRSKHETNLPDEEALNALIGARSGFWSTRNGRFSPLLRHVITSLLLYPPVLSLTCTSQSSEEINNCYRW
jgi:hypothetical protein